MAVRTTNSIKLVNQEYMSEVNEENKVISQLKEACRPVTASSRFKELLLNRLIPKVPAPRSCLPSRRSGLRPESSPGTEVGWRSTFF